MPAQTQPQSGFLPVHGGNIYFEVAGEGHPLVLIHEAVADHRMWDPQVVEFSKHFRTIRYDMRAFGKSRNTEDVEFSNHQDLYDLLKHLGVEKTYVLGASRGGQVAIDFTLEHPEMVDALIPVAAGVGGFQAQPTEIEAALFKQSQEAEDQHYWERAAALDVRIWADGPAQPEGRAPSEVREKMRQMCLDTYLNNPIEGRPQPLRPPAINRLGEIHVPTLVALGDLDASAITAVADVLVAGIAGARKVVIPGTAHALSMEKPDEFNRIVLDFLLSL
jgi:3-oxoadipate enol-lactonase